MNHSVYHGQCIDPRPPCAQARTALRLRDAGTAHAKGSGVAAIARALRSPRTMPNILRVKILAARGLRERPRLKPRVEVKVSDARLVPARICPRVPNLRFAAVGAQDERVDSLWRARRAGERQ